MNTGTLILVIYGVGFILTMVVSTLEYIFCSSNNEQELKEELHNNARGEGGSSSAVLLFISLFWPISLFILFIVLPLTKFFDKIDELREARIKKKIEEKKLERALKAPCRLE